MGTSWWGEHAGLYTAIASNAFGVVTGTVAMLLVNASPPSRPELNLAAATVVEGNPVTFAAQGRGAPPPPSPSN